MQRLFCAIEYEEEQAQLGDLPLRPRRRPVEHVRPSNRDTTRINEAIRVPNVRLIDDDGGQLGIKTTDEAREYAYGKNLDLVVSTGSLPWSTGSTDVLRMLDGVTEGQSINQIKSDLEDINREPGSKAQLWKVDGFNDN